MANTVVDEDDNAAPHEDSLGESASTSTATSTSTASLAPLPPRIRSVISFDKGARSVLIYYCPFF